METYNLISTVLLQRKKLILLFVYLFIGGLLLIFIRQFISTDKSFIF